MKLSNISDPRNANKKMFLKKKWYRRNVYIWTKFSYNFKFTSFNLIKRQMSFNPGKNQVRKNKTRFYWHIAWISKFLFHNIGLRLCSECFKFIDGKVCQTLLIDCPFAWTVSRSSIKSWMVSNIHTMYNGYCFLPLCNVSS